MSEWQIKRILESNQSLPSEVVASSLYMGGFVAAMNIEFLTSKGVTLVVNTASGLEKHFPKYGRVRSEEYVRVGVEGYSVEWVDSEDQVLEEEELRVSVGVIDERLRRGEGVLVHCAQVQ